MHNLPSKINSTRFRKNPNQSWAVTYSNGRISVTRWKCSHKSRCIMPSSVLVREEIRSNSQESIEKEIDVYGTSLSTDYVTSHFFESCLASDIIPLACITIRSRCRKLQTYFVYQLSSVKPSAVRSRDQQVIIFGLAKANSSTERSHVLETIRHSHSSSHNQMQYCAERIDYCIESSTCCRQRIRC